MKTPASDKEQDAEELGDDDIRLIVEMAYVMIKNAKSANDRRRIHLALKAHAELSKLKTKS